jgi:hypothetical protein
MSPDMELPMVDLLAECAPPPAGRTPPYLCITCAPIKSDPQVRLSVDQILLKCLLLNFHELSLQIGDTGSPLAPRR